jgi:predicted ABC-type ATPase
MNTDKPKLLVIAGPNGSGKTTITTQILKHEWVEGCVYINPDNIAKDHFGDWNSPEAVLKAAKWATKERERCLALKQDFIFETVFSAIDKVTFLQEAKAAGFFVRLFFVCTHHPSINAARIANRVIEGGHDVPIPKIISRYYKSIANCSLIAPYVDRLYVYDN